uniref:Uncharacterized protein n=2 Tax=Timema TaxID=61471 RepID=A0A7R9FWL0_TIMSH|nr:unnamed protein product [Timema shepardi]CAD7569515.1 unnamed protein product [Timema californicum]
MSGLLCSTILANQNIAGFLRRTSGVCTIVLCFEFLFILAFVMNSQVVFLMVVMVTMALIQGAWSLSLDQLVDGAVDTIARVANTVYTNMNSQVVILMVVMVSMAFIQGAWSAPQNPLADIVSAFRNALANGK